MSELVPVLSSQSPAWAFFPVQFERGQVKGQHGSDLTHTNEILTQLCVQYIAVYHVRRLGCSVPNHPSWLSLSLPLSNPDCYSSPLILFFLFFCKIDTGDWLTKIGSSYSVISILYIYKYFALYIILKPSFYHILHFLAVCILPINYIS